MLGRRHYRIKVLQGLYAYFQGGETRIEKAEKNLLQSIDKIGELYFLQISFFLELIDFYIRRMEEAKHKFYPTYEEINPSTKLVDNLVVQKLKANKDLDSKIRKYKFNWIDEQENIRKVYLRIRESKEHRDYLYSGEHSYKEDLEVVSKILKKFVLRSPELQFYCEERSIHWVDDFEVAGSFVLKTIRLLPPDFPDSSPLPSLFIRDIEEDQKEERQFIVDLFRNTILHSDEYEKMIEGRTQNWELDRIALTDIILIKMALAELLHFPTVPIKVTLNEYIELSKSFSTVKSKLFINGILDKLASDLIEQDRIHKTGRGLIN
ncbi:MAG: transcription antitermination factor NusB [bacterium]